MQFTYEIISSSELTKADRVLLALKGEEFYFFRSKGIVKINKAQPKVASLVKIGTAMWQIDRLLDSVDAEAMDKLWREAEEIAGEEAAAQLYRAWSTALDEKMEREATRAAKEWMEGRNIIDDLDTISDAVEYSSKFLKALWRETTDTDAIFVYGYQLGLQAARKAGEA